MRIGTEYVLSVYLHGEVVLEKERVFYFLGKANMSTFSLSAKYDAVF